jgi:signal transduction histidine kinase
VTGLWASSCRVGKGLGRVGVVKSKATALFIQPFFGYHTIMLVPLTPDIVTWIILVASIALVVGMILASLGYHFRGGRKTQTIRQNARREIERASHNERERLRRIYDLISSLTATLNYQRVVDTALDLSASALGTATSPADRLVSAVLLFSQKEAQQTELTVACARRFTPADMRVGLPGRGGLIGKAIETAQPAHTKNISQDTELGRIVTLRACHAAYCLPLRFGLDTYGVLLYAHPEPDYFSPAHRETLGIIAHQASIAIQNALLYRSLEQEKERMMEIQEEARKKLARDLHDGPTQSVAAIAMRVNFARRLIERDVKAAAEELYKIEDLSRRTTKEIRHMLFTLRPLVLESQGLVAAFESMAEKMHETYNQNVIIDADANVIPSLEMGKQAVIFYIAEEAVNNARKHAQAAHTWLRLKAVESNLVLLEIEDDGVGFNVGEVDSSYEKRGSLGLVNMRERAELVNGVLQIDSAEGKGTRIRVLIPTSEEAVERLRRGR